MQAAAVSRWLLETRGIAAQAEWLGACVQWIYSEEGAGVSERNLQQLVYEQWLHADLRDTVDPSSACIPQTLIQQQECQIRGTFIVQVNSVLDVGLPAYGQLQKLKGQGIDSAETPRKKNTAAEAKPSRLLLLSLTDGVFAFQAMEYQSIPCLNSQLDPGVKLLLQGTIDCRLGTLLLSAGHVQVLGGSVEQLAETNSSMKVLARMLNNESLAEQPDRSHGQHPNAAGGSSDQQSAGSPAQPSAGSHDQQLHTTVRSHDQHSVGSHDQQLHTTVRSHDQHSVGSPNQQHTTVRSHDQHSAESHDQHSAGSHDQQHTTVRLHDQHSAGSHDQQHTTVRSHEQHTLSLRSHEQPLNVEVNQTLQDCNELSLGDLEQFGDIEEELIRQAEADAGLAIEEDNECPEFEDAFTINDDDDIEVEHSLDQLDNLEDNYEIWHSENEILAGENDYSLSDNFTPSTVNEVTTSGINEDQPPFAIGEESHSPTFEDKESNPIRQAVRYSKSLSLSRKTKRRLSDDPCDDPCESLERQQCVKKRKPPVASVKPINFEGKELQGTTSIPESSPSSSDDDSGGESLSERAPILLHNLTDVVKHLAQRLTVKVKAHVVKIADRLGHSTGVWMVSVVIGDDCGMKLQVNLSNEILEKLLGFSAIEFRDRIIPFKSDKKVKARATKAFKYCQSALADFNCFMVIRRSSQHKHPLVVKLLQS